MPREENSETDIVAKLVASRIAEILMNFMEVAESLCIKRMMVGTLEERKDWQTSII